MSRKLGFLFASCDILTLPEPHKVAFCQATQKTGTESWSSFTVSTFMEKFLNVLLEEEQALLSVLYSQRCLQQWCSLQWPTMTPPNDTSYYGTANDGIYQLLHDLQCLHQHQHCNHVTSNDCWGLSPFVHPTIMILQLILKWSVRLYRGLGNYQVLQISS